MARAQCRRRAVRGRVIGRRRKQSRLGLRIENVTHKILHVIGRFLSKRRAAAALAMLCWLVAAKCVNAQSAGAAGKIGAIRVKGQKTLTAEQVIAATGLKAGQEFDPQQLNAVAERLGKSGAFSDITYSYVSQGGLMAIDFKVEEAKFRACHFDNFVWLSDDEINARLKKELPLYNGMAPETGALLDQIPGVLEVLSKEKTVTVHVSRRVQQSAIGDPNWSHMYVAEDADVKVQSVRFSGTVNVSADDLQKVVVGIVGKDYSAFKTALMGSLTIQPFFSERGYLRANVERPLMKVVSHANGTNQFAVELAYAVTEGELFHWKSAEWNGDALIPAAELDTLTEMKPNDVANAKKINEGWMAVKSAYAKRGYIEAQILPEAVFDDANPLVHYRVTITEGPQYRMGTFTVTGAPAKIAERLAERWKLKAVDAFDGGYPLEYLNKEAVPLLRGGFTRPPKLGISMAPNRTQHTIDVTLKVE